MSTKQEEIVLRKTSGVYYWENWEIRKSLFGLYVAVCSDKEIFFQRCSLQEVQQQLAIHHTAVQNGHRPEGYKKLDGSIDLGMDRPPRKTKRKDASSKKSSSLETETQELVNAVESFLLQPLGSRSFAASRTALKRSIAQLKKKL